MPQFEFSLYSVGSDSTVIPCEAINDDEEDGKQILYLDSLSHEKYEKPSPKYYKFKIKQKNKAEENVDKFLIHFKLEFNAEKYHENEQVTINQWKLWHESIFKAFAKKLEFISIKKSTDTIRDMSGANTLANNRTFLWDFEMAECEFDVQFGCHSTQFPIQVDNNRYVGSLFLLTVDVYSVLSKAKLKSHTFKLKISRSNSSQFKLDSGIAQELTEFKKTEAPKPPLIEQNLQELLASLNVSNNNNNVDKQLANTEAVLPSFEKLKEVKLDQSLFSYKMALPTKTSNTISEAYFEQENSSRREFAFQIENLHFNNFYNHNELVKSVITLKFKHVHRNRRNWSNIQEKTILDWEQNWIRANPGRSLLQYVNSSADDTALFDAYTIAYNQFCLIWLPSAVNKLLVSINIDDNLELKEQRHYETTLSVESFLISNNEKVDHASCKLNFVNDSNYSTNQKFCLLKSEPSYLIGRVLYISVDGDDYKFLVFQNTFVDSSQLHNGTSLKSKLVDFIRKIRNMDTLFKIRNVKYLKSSKDTATRRFELKYLQPKTVLKCTLRKVEKTAEELLRQADQLVVKNTEEIEPKKGKQTNMIIEERMDRISLQEYDVDLIDQEEYYLKSYI